MSKNKVLLELSHAHLFTYYHYVYKYFWATRAEVSSGSGDRMA